MENLSSVLLYKILSYTEVKAVAVLECLSKSSQNKLRLNSKLFNLLIQKRLYANGEYEFDECMNFVILFEYQKVLPLLFVAYQSNSGIYRDLGPDAKYHFRNLLVDNGEQCTLLPSENIVVKAVLSGEYANPGTVAHFFGLYSANSDEERVAPEGMDYYVARVFDECTSKKYVGLIREIFISYPAWGFTAPMKTIVVFSSLSPEGDDMINSFQSARDLADLQTRADAMQLKYSIIDGMYYQLVQFRRKRGASLQPIMWFSFKESAYEAKSQPMPGQQLVPWLTGMKVSRHHAVLADLFPASFMHVLIIDRFCFPGSGPETDCDSIIPYGFLVPEDYV